MLQMLAALMYISLVFSTLQYNIYKKQLFYFCSDKWHFFLLGHPFATPAVAFFAQTITEHSVFILTKRYAKPVWMDGQAVIVLTRCGNWRSLPKVLSFIDQFFAEYKGGWFTYSVGVVQVCCKNSFLHFIFFFHFFFRRMTPKNIWSRCLCQKFHEKDYEKITAIVSKEEETIELDKPVMAQGKFHFHFMGA